MPTKDDQEKKYNRDYYQRNRDRIVQRKRKRYQEDEEYRQEVISKAKEYKKKKKEYLAGRVERTYKGKVYLVHRVGVLKDDKIDGKWILEWERAGVIPEALFVGSRCYTEHQLDLIREFRYLVSEHGGREAKVRIGDKLHNEWMNSI
ncbi:MAG: hypothetical protein GWN00_01240 [Aliifodinibius sp.]|nr:hypothetical protein [Fodinibius sp.]NIV09956.1 hypothetical protein [Fodinibius sp.]NIY23486.1 hypothetical protein [Fodinibius sp.]